MSGFKKTILGAVGSRFMAQAKVEEVSIISDRFRLVTLSSEKFKTATMQPGAKVRLNAHDWELRAYTPLSVDAVPGRIQILAYLHGVGPGSIWAGSAMPGTLTHVLGPQSSLDFIGLSQPAVFFGDETSFAAAQTLQSHLSPHHATQFIFEISSAVEAQAVADRLGLRDVEYHERRTADAHIPVVTEAIQHALAGTGTSHLIMTGNGRSIQAIRAILRARHSGVIDYRVKAYWGSGQDRFGMKMDVKGQLNHGRS